MLLLTGILSVGRGLSYTGSHDEQRPQVRTPDTSGGAAVVVVCDQAGRVGLPRPPGRPAQAVGRHRVAVHRPDRPATPRRAVLGATGPKLLRDAAGHGRPGHRPGTTRPDHPRPRPGQPPPPADQPDRGRPRPAGPARIRRPGTGGTDARRPGPHRARRPGRLPQPLPRRTGDRTPTLTASGRARKIGPPSNRADRVRRGGRRPTLLRLADAICQTQDKPWVIAGL